MAKIEVLDSFYYIVQRKGVRLNATQISAAIKLIDEGAKDALQVLADIRR